MKYRACIGGLLSRSEDRRGALIRLREYGYHIEIDLYDV